MNSPPDLDALLVALVLAPATYSRNRFFELYQDPSVRHVRRRAALVRSIVRHVAPVGDVRTDAIVNIASTPTGGAELTYTVPSLGLRRTTILEPVEAALIRFAMARSSNSAGLAPPGDEDPDRQQIEAALRRLAPLAPPNHTAERPQPAKPEPVA